MDLTLTVPAPAALDAALTALRAANAHISTGCSRCTPAAQVPDMCPEGQSLALAAVDLLTL
ncbi:hypothetical protein [Streptomyces sp. H27-H5]|uniref:hypothetical protein n=1 Tax=Streptomyces sp. H27-H5 TaxID=2996460 RepID=UPI00226E7D1B|nr:hypothetical protein [Streptomyces sp. H27-H5]MCY0957674.1 hypothetical protein [Streptomyces sp. H27-H5]